MSKINWDKIKSNRIPYRDHLEWAIERRDELYTDMITKSRLVEFNRDTHMYDIYYEDYRTAESKYEGNETKIKVYTIFVEEGRDKGDNEEYEMSNKQFIVLSILFLLAVIVSILIPALIYRYYFLHNSEYLF